MGPEIEEEIGIADDESYTKRELGLVDDVKRLRADLERSRKNAKVPKGLVEAKKILRPIYDALKMIFEEVKESEDAGASNPAWRIWIEKAGSGVQGKMLAVVLERGELTRSQLATLAGTGIRSSSFDKALSWMRSNKLVVVEGQTVRRVQL